MDLILVRHLAPPNGEGRCYGRTDLPAGTDPAALRRLAALPRPRRIVTSPLRRCRRLARALGAGFRVAVTVDPAWAEIDFGTWEGLPWEAVPRQELDAWAADLLHARPHGGESVAMLLARTRRALRHTPRGSLVITHAGAIRAALVATGAGQGAWRRSVAFGEAVPLGRP